MTRTQAIQALQAQGISQDTAAAILDQAVIFPRAAQPAGSSQVQWDHATGFIITPAQQPGHAARPTPSGGEHDPRAAAIRRYLQNLIERFNTAQGEDWDYFDVVEHLMCDAEGLGIDPSIGLE